MIASLTALLLSTAIAADSSLFIRVNQVGYLPGGRKVAVACALRTTPLRRFTVEDLSGHRVLGPLPARATGEFSGCAATYRLDFSALRSPGTYRVRAGSAVSPAIRIGEDVYAGGVDVLMAFMRVQRSGFNPFFRDSLHVKTDATLVDHPNAGEHIPVAGGWADAADYLQYVTTSATATYDMLAAYRDYPGTSGDTHLADGLPGSNGVADILDEARHGLEWLNRMYPREDLLLNQLADDRDHAYWDLPTNDSADYGWGRRGPRPVYPCTGKPQGLNKFKNRANGYASTAGKFASAMAAGAALLKDTDPAFADTLARKARTAYELGRKYPGACQTASAVSPYFYEEDSWADDMELGAAELFALTREPRYLTEAVQYARMEPVTLWMGQDTANHYQWYPWQNPGHFEVWRLGGPYQKELMATFYRRGLAAVAERANNGFRMGVPFIWCSNDLVIAVAVQARFYRQMTGDTTFAQMEQAAVDWLFGTNPWGTSMVIGYPAGAVTPTDPHSVISRQLGWQNMTGGLIDGPVYRAIFENLKGLRLTKPDVFEAFNKGRLVYHNDWGDYSTNEPIMDGSAALSYLVAGLAKEGEVPAVRATPIGR